MRYRLLIALGIVVAATWSVMAAPRALVVDANGEVRGVLNNLRASVQGRRFWSGQMSILESDLQSARTWPFELAQLDADIERVTAPALRDLDKVVDNFYADHPEMRPTAAEREAQDLRKRADEIESNENDRQMRALYEARVRELEKIRPRIMAKLGP